MFHQASSTALMLIKFPSHRSSTTKYVGTMLVSNAIKKNTFFHHSEDLPPIIDEILLASMLFNTRPNLPASFPNVRFSFSMDVSSRCVSSVISQFPSRLFTLNTVLRG